MKVLCKMNSYVKTLINISGIIDQLTWFIFCMLIDIFSGFMQLHLEDRILLTKCSIYRLLLLAASQRYDLETGKHYLFGWRSWEAAPSRLVSLYPEYEVSETLFLLIL